LQSQRKANHHWTVGCKLEAQAKGIDLAAGGGDGFFFAAFLATGFFMVFIAAGLLATFFAIAPDARQKVTRL